MGADTLATAPLLHNFWLVNMAPMYWEVSPCILPPHDWGHFFMNVPDCTEGMFMWDTLSAWKEEEKRK